MKKRQDVILVLTNNIGGLHSFRFEVVKAIVDAGYLVFISVPDDDERAKYFEEIGCQMVKTRFNRRGDESVGRYNSDVEISASHP